MGLDLLSGAEVALRDPRDEVSAQGRDRTGTPLQEQIFETCASTNSATWAGVGKAIYHARGDSSTSPENHRDQAAQDQG